MENLKMEKMSQIQIYGLLSKKVIKNSKLPANICPLNVWSRPCKEKTDYEYTILNLFLKYIFVHLITIALFNHVYMNFKKVFL